MIIEGDDTTKIQIEYCDIDDVPVKVGDELEYVAKKLDDEVDYKDARRRHYPTFGTQFDALYWATLIE